MKIILFIIALLFALKKIFNIKINKNNLNKNKEAIDVEYEEIE